ncbi:hypothetical protein O181_015287 [Austropuccinia psidii MF-1]|uniref:Uncharacterized protein n=1 Tax=Austropuccinia psidii MF-1 TaxID=1389203 RepID=A0A9Q3GQM8_9BASI|nr:hypothetical protein [Austropuccinia psidii MF-1]
MQNSYPVSTPMDTGIYLYNANDDDDSLFLAPNVDYRHAVGLINYLAVSNRANLAFPLVLNILALPFILPVFIFLHMPMQVMLTVLPLGGHIQGFCSLLAVISFIGNQEGTRPSRDPPRKLSIKLCMKADSKLQKQTVNCSSYEFDVLNLYYAHGH